MKLGWRGRARSGGCTPLGKTSPRSSSSARPRGWADRWSDVELLVCWAALPTERQFGTLAERAGAGTRRVFPGEPLSDGIDEEWQGTGSKVDVLHRTVAGIDRVILDVVRRHDTSWPKQAQVEAIRDGIVMHGEGLIENWSDRSAYTDDLTRAMVAAHLTFGPHAWLEMLAERVDAL